MKRLTIGILGASRIAPLSIIAPARRRDDVAVTAVASRSGAAQYAKTHGIDRAYDSYEALLADPLIDLIYVALPPSMHAEWSIAALRAGKDVLCEKPMTMSAAQAEAVHAAAEESGRRAIVAFHDYYHPLQTWIREFLASDGLGKPERVTAVFNGPKKFDPSSNRQMPELGGGALMDLGCYPMHWVRSFFGEPHILDATAELNPLGADLTIHITMELPGDVQGIVSASMKEDETLESTLLIEGTTGSLRVNNLVFPSAGHTIVVTTEGIERVTTVAGQQTYDHQLEAVIAGLQSGSPLPTEAPDYVLNMAAMDSSFAASGITRQY